MVEKTKNDRIANYENSIWLLIESILIYLMIFMNVQI